jgi:hypothetical protein
MFLHDLLGQSSDSQGNGHIDPISQVYGRRALQTIFANLHCSPSWLVSVVPAL